ncbi:MAG: hypothetical protein QOH04_3177 [Sphingomonadales bacterium]|jgi:hypothetical protein|nr:hypothetical protein [Sphingomonadales bacterium]
MALVVVGLLLIAVTPLVGPIPGPGGILVFAAGLTLVLRYSDWAKKQYVRLKKKHPKKGAWADWGLRRQSHLRREAKRMEREAAEAAMPAKAPADLEGIQAVETAELHVGTLHLDQASEPGRSN